ncbi:hypothetical protein [Atlantibacter hermannii]|uniref:hypothetical protein n=1 Tax=Atlantibacter hermannii TaxID=565 RepID=UPI0028ADA249|nr:hypothetical protein [Atlantibacter hermannii]
MTFTKEQLIAKAREQIAFCRHTKITGEGRTHVNQCSALFEIALAALTAEPVAWTDEQELRDVAKDGCGYLFTVKPITPNADPRRIIKLYTRPQPAPVVVPDEIDINDPALDTHRKWMAEGWNRCRAAMLQGGK